MTDALPDAALAVKDGEIPLPPPELWAELDNSGAPTEAVADPEPKPEQVKQTVAVLEFVGEERPFKSVPLRYPFRFEGVRHDAIVVRRLSVQEVGDFMDALPESGVYQRTELYGLMCGLPGAVIRALPDVDGDAVMEACMDFLPLGLGGGRD